MLPVMDLVVILARLIIHVKCALLALIKMMEHVLSVAHHVSLVWMEITLNVRHVRVHFLLMLIAMGTVSPVKLQIV